MGLGHRPLLAADDEEERLARLAPGTADRPELADAVLAEAERPALGGPEFVEFTDELGGAHERVPRACVVARQRPRTAQDAAEPFS